jgi:hypothetical protein
MAEDRERPRSEPLSGEDLGFWWGDQPRQRSTMAMLPARPAAPFDRLRAAAWRAVEVPRLRQRVVDAPFDRLARAGGRPPSTGLHAPLCRLHDDGSPQHATLQTKSNARPDLRTALRPQSAALGADRADNRPGLGALLPSTTRRMASGNAIPAALTDAEADPATPPARGEPGCLGGESCRTPRQCRGPRPRGSGARPRRAPGPGMRWCTIFLAGRPGRAGSSGSLACPTHCCAPGPRDTSGFELPFEPLRKARAAPPVDDRPDATAVAVPPGLAPRQRQGTCEVMTRCRSTCGRGRSRGSAPAPGTGPPA